MDHIQTLYHDSYRKGLETFKVLLALQVLLLKLLLLGSQLILLIKPG